MELSSFIGFDTTESNQFFHCFTVITAMGGPQLRCHCNATECILNTVDNQGFPFKFYECKDIKCMLSWKAYLGTG